MADNISSAFDHRRYAPAAQRNREPILAALAPRLTGARRLLEIASGSGEHAVWLAAELPALRWLPSDADATALASIAGWTAHSGVANVAPPRMLDVTAAAWPLEDGELPLDAMFTANLLHIAPWAVTLGLLAGAGRYLSGSGALYIYGPFMRNGAHTADSNARFDAGLRQQNPAWGVRALEDVAAEAGRHGLALAEAIDMPANNIIAVFRRSQG